jgi:UDP-4-amino-4,6-dideoxy-N-acetyl-beta-L-altrosamine N-acetyltransferase
MVEQAEEASRVRPMTQSDLDCVLSWRNHPDVRRYMYSQNEITLDEHQRWFVRTLQDPHKHMLIFEVGKKPFGFVNFSELACGGVADWGFYAAPAAPKGTGRRLGMAALDHAFKQINLHKICGRVIGYNDRSIRFHQSLGFQQEGILRDQHYDGERFHHVICFGLLSHEWQPKP